jgi:hypothetical protein
VTSPPSCVGSRKRQSSAERSSTMQGIQQAKTHNRTGRREGEGGLVAPIETPTLPRWESFPLEDRHRLVRTILQAALRQVEAGPVSSHPRR